MQVDAVEQRARYFRLVIDGAFGGAVAGLDRIVQITAAAWTRCLFAVLQSDAHNPETQRLRHHSTDSW